MPEEPLFHSLWGILCAGLSCARIRLSPCSFTLLMLDIVAVWVLLAKMIAHLRTLKLSV
jgi:hypothetical protein